MAYPTIRQEATGKQGSAGPSVTVSVTLGSTPTPGNYLLVTLAQYSSDLTAIPTPSGFTEINQAEVTNGGFPTTASLWLGWFYREVQAGDGTSWSFVEDMPAAILGMAAMYEIENLDIASVQFDAGDVDNGVLTYSGSAPFDCLVITSAYAIPGLGQTLSNDNSGTNWSPSFAGWTLDNTIYDSTDTYYGSMSTAYVTGVSNGSNIQLSWQWDPANEENLYGLGTYLCLQYEAAVPAAPVLSGTASNTENTLTWTTPANNGSAITDYSLLRGTSSGGESGTPIYTALANTYTDTGLTNGTTYYYEVYATNGIGNSADSNEVALTPETGGTPVQAPSPLTAPFTQPPRITVTTSGPIGWGPQYRAGIGGRSKS